MTKFRILSLIFAFIAASAWSQVYGTGDGQLDGFLVDMNASAKLDLPGFYAEVNFDWGIPVATLKAAGASLDPAGVYMAAAIAALGKQPFETVVSTYKANAAKGWGFIAKQMGIKPGSKEFKQLKTKAEAKAKKLKKKK